MPKTPSQKNPTIKKFRELGLNLLALEQMAPKSKVKLRLPLIHCSQSRLNRIPKISFCPHTETKQKLRKVLDSDSANAMFSSKTDGSTDRLKCRFDISNIRRKRQSQQLEILDYKYAHDRIRESVELQEAQNMKKNAIVSPEDVKTSKSWSQKSFVLYRYSDGSVIYIRITQFIELILSFQMQLGLNLKEQQSLVYLDENLNLHHSVLTELQKIDNLKFSSKKAQQQKYMKTFAIILDKIHGELEQAQKSYDVSDVERKKALVCAQLNQELKLHKKRCMELQGQLKRGRSLLEREKRREMLLQNDQSALVVALQRKTDEKHILKVRARHLESSPMLMDRQEKRGGSGDRLNMLMMHSYADMSTRNTDEMRQLLTQVRSRRHSQNSAWDIKRLPMSQRKPRKHLNLSKSSVNDGKSLVSEKIYLQPRIRTRINKPIIDLYNLETRK